MVAGMPDRKGSVMAQRTRANLNEPQAFRDASDLSCSDCNTVEVNVDATVPNKALDSVYASVKILEHRGFKRVENCVDVQALQNPLLRFKFGAVDCLHCNCFIRFICFLRFLKLLHLLHCVIAVPMAISIDDGRARPFSFCHELIENFRMYPKEHQIVPVVAFHIVLSQTSVVCKLALTGKETH